MSLHSFLTILGMMCATYFTRLVGFFLLRRVGLTPRAKRVMDIAPACVLISVIAPHFVSQKPNELIALVVAMLVASHFGMLATIFAAIATATIMGFFI